ncbi:MAG TPA: chemotaxis-specific protein-glutamate methyltransferase CheB [Mycobacteriales bacterium]|nr:chemotaxis-specific protein-glutamate methyltransferase CheB [Mycobacteriales bacterium]
MSAQPESASPVTVVVVDDSATQRRFIRGAVAADPMLEVVGEARTGRDAIALVERHRPTVVLMDLHLPVMNGIQAIERIMALRPTPIVVYSSFVDGEDRANAESAYAAGAVDVMAKPGTNDSGRLEEYAEALRQRLRVAGRVRVITHPRGRLGGSSSSLTTMRLGMVAQMPATTGSTVTCEPSAELIASLEAREVKLLAIGASTGGPQALAAVLAGLPERTTIPILVVQHMADGFMEGLAEWLNDVCPLPVALAVDGRRLVPGTVALAPSGQNLIVHDRYRVTMREPDPGQYHVPGIDTTFTSVADAYRSTSVGVLLTGMGRDGAAGLKRIRDEGGLTIGQDESTSTVYGMPAAAMSADAVDIQLPLPEICTAIHHLLATSPPVDPSGAAP